MPPHVSVHGYQSRPRSNLRTGRYQNIYADLQDVVLALDRPRALGPGLSGFQRILTQDLGYEFPRISPLGSLANKNICPYVTRAGLCVEELLPEKRLKPSHTKAASITRPERGTPKRSS